MQSNLDEFIQNSNNVLLLQGPVGHFFHHFGQFLKQKHQKQVFKINFNGGDRHFYPETAQNEQVVSYTGTVDDFDAFLADFVHRHQIDNIVCFGDTRIYHRKAKALCKASQPEIGFWVFEEGYFRPDYITFEKTGVNYFSPEPREADFYLSQHMMFPALVPPKHMAPGFWSMAKMAALYYIHMQLHQHCYSTYQHHRSTRLFWYGKSWLQSGWLKLLKSRREKELAIQIEHGMFDPFYVVPLQVHNDSQIKVHSRFKSVAAFIKHIIQDFSVHAPAGVRLIIKHHPMDRGFTDYAKLIKKLQKHYNLQQRIFYIYDIPLPILLRRAQGVITINSTSGLSAMIHHLPVKVMGQANYGIPGLVDLQPLSNFWRQPKPLDLNLFQAFRHYHLYKTQINDSFYIRNSMVDYW